MTPEEKEERQREYDELSEAELRRQNDEIAKFLDRVWDNKFGSVLQAQKLILEWLFLVHAGGLAGAITFGAKELSGHIKWSVASFSSGLILLLIYGALMFFFEKHWLGEFLKHLSVFRVKTRQGGVKEKAYIDLLGEINKAPSLYQWCLWVALASGASAAVGVIELFMAVLR